MPWCGKCRCRSGFSPARLAFAAVSLVGAPAGPLARAEWMNVIRIPSRRGWDAAICQAAGHRSAQCGGASAAWMKPGARCSVMGRLRLAAPCGGWRHLSPLGSHASLAALRRAGESKPVSQTSCTCCPAEDACSGHGHGWRFAPFSRRRTCWSPRSRAVSQPGVRRNGVRCRAGRRALGPGHRHAVQSDPLRAGSGRRVHRNHQPIIAPKFHERALNPGMGLATQCARLMQALSATPTRCPYARLRVASTWRAP